MIRPSYRIVEYDPHSPALFEEEKARVLIVLGINGDRVAHIGSTAVPGLASKPIIDLMVGVRAAEDTDVLVPRLAAIGYEHRGDTVPGTLYLRKAEPRRYNLHMTAHDGDFWVDHLLFRDYLRAHPDVARDYEELKRSTMAKLAHDPGAYNDSKAGFIEAVIARAHTWRRFDNDDSRESTLVGK